VDAVSDDQLYAIGDALDGMALITGGSGIALGLPENYRRAGWIGENKAADQVPAISGKSAILSGSCSAATLGQIATFAKNHPTYQLDPLALAKDAGAATQAALDWATSQPDGATPLVYASAPPEDVAKIQSELGRAEAGELVEQAMAKIAKGLTDAGVRRLVVAGGETSGAVVGALGITGLMIGAQIDPGVPGCVTIDDPNMALALKSGNFGAEDFFEKALRMMP
jgi:uncharacterized protein YgbK (DUF1537 family)